MSTGWSHPAYERIASLVANKTGLTFLNRRLDTETGIRRAMEHTGVIDVAQFAGLLDTDQRSLDNVVSELTVGETYFFRDQQHFDFIRDHVFPDVIARRGVGHTIRIWSAGCASGEEAYSLAMTLDEAGLTSHLLATDLSRRALQRARAASYRRWSLRGVDDALIERCFHHRGAEWVLDERFRRRVTFEFHNLASDVYPSVSAGIWGMDLILCRNVLIYLEAETVRRVAGQLADTLAENGWLISGPSDPPLDGIASLSPVVTARGVFYRKDAAHVSGRPPQFSNAIRPENLFPPPAPPPATAVESSGDRLPIDEASAASRVRDIVTHNGSALALKELGFFLERFPLSSELHVLRAVLQMDLERYDEAARSLRRALFLDRTLVVAHFMLATVLRRQGQLDEARRAYRNARDLAAARPPDEALPLADGERAGRMADVAAAELALLETRQAAS